MYEDKLKFPEGRGVQNKKPSVGGGGGEGYGYFLELHIVYFTLIPALSNRLTH